MRTLPPRVARVRRLTGSASVAVRSLLLGAPQELTTAAVYPAALHLAEPSTGRIRLALVAHDGVAHPHAMVLTLSRDAVPFDGIRVYDAFQVGERRVVTPRGDHVEVARWWSPRPVLGHVDPPVLQEGVRIVDRHLAELAPPLEDLERSRLHALTEAVINDDGDLAAAAAHGLLGLGAGSTPTGDDLLAGLIAGMRLLVPATEPDMARSVALVSDLADQLVTASVSATTAVSHALLRHAVAGEVCRPAARLLVVLVRDVSEGTRREALEGLLRVGSLSGRDLAYGLLAAATIATAPEPGRARPLVVPTSLSMPSMSSPGRV